MGERALQAAVEWARTRVQGRLAGGPDPAPPARGIGWTDSSLLVAEHIQPLISGGPGEGHWLLAVSC